MKKPMTLSNVLRAKNLRQKTIGLLHTKTPQSLYLQTRFGIHTFGMQYAIDIIILDDQFTVKKMKQNLKPQQIYLWNPKYQHVLELPEGTIEKKKINIGDKIKINHLIIQ